MSGWRGRARVPLAVYGTLTALLVALQHLSNRVLRDEHYRVLRWLGLRNYLGGLSQFDGNDYQEIAAHGYHYTPGQKSRIVWFPLYPIVMRVVDVVTSDLLVAGVVVTCVAGAAAFVAYWRWTGDRGLSGTVRLTALAALALYPYGWYLYGVVYADALLLVLVIVAFLLAGRDHLVWAGVVGALATATRPTGIALVAPLVLVGLVRGGVLSSPDGATGWRARFAVPTRVDRSKLRPVHLAPLLSVVGLGAFMAYQWARFGSPTLFLSNEKLYRPDGLPILHRGFASAWLHFGHDPRYALTTLGQATCLLVIVLTVPACCRRFGFAYGLYVALVAAMPTISTGDFMGTGRYLIAAFPAFAIVGTWLAERPALRTPALATCGLVMGFLAFHFSRSAYLS